MSEFDFIDWLRARQCTSAFVQLPAGDDLAILAPEAGDLLVVGVDQVLEGVHFDLKQHTLADVGRKVVNRNLSDCAAMACRPAALVVSVALPKSLSIDDARALYLGMERTAGEFDCAIVGGDTGSWTGPLAASVTVIGRSDGVTPVRRSGARPGDYLHVTGPLGGSILGSHMTFTPRVTLARHLASRSLIHAMIDLSDGLSGDAAHLARESSVALVFNAALIPIHDDAHVLSARDAVAALDHALHDGEDYELLIAGPEPHLNGCTPVGRVEAGTGVWIEQNGIRTPLPRHAWTHDLSDE